MVGSISSHFVGFSGGLLMSVIAFSIVFIVALGLMIMMMLLKIVVGSFGVRTEKPAHAAASAAPTPASAPAASAATPAVLPTSVSGDSDEEIAAVIIAAITAMAGAGAQVVSFAPAAAAVSAAPSSAPRGGFSAWKMCGILSNSEGYAD